MSPDAQTGTNGAATAEQILGDGAAPATETLTVTDNRTGSSYELPIAGRNGARDGPQADQDRRSGLRPDGL